MAQAITNNTELLDGSQIANKLTSALKSGQTAFASNDLRCYDKGQILTKYDAYFNGVYATSGNERLPAHEGYKSSISFKFGSTPGNAYNAIYSTYLYIDPNFNGTAVAEVRNGSTLYTTSNNPVGAGYFMFYTGANWAYWTTNSSGVVNGNYQTYAPLTPVAYYGFLNYYLFTYDLAEDKNSCYYSGQYGTIYYNSSNFVYYQDQAMTYTALPGLYMTVQGTDGYPTFSDSEFLILNP